MLQLLEIHDNGTVYDWEPLNQWRLRHLHYAQTQWSWEPWCIRCEQCHSTAYVFTGEIDQIQN